MLSLKYNFNRLEVAVFIENFSNKQNIKREDALPSSDTSELFADPFADPLTSDPMSEDPLFKETTPKGMKEKTRGHDKVTVADVDGDGREDLIFSRSADPKSKDEALRHAHHVVYRNTEEGLVDYTKESGLENLPADQLLFGDLDGDGDQDVVGLQRNINNPDPDPDGEGTLRHTVYEQGLEEATDGTAATWTANNDLLKGVENLPMFPAISGRLRDLDNDSHPDLILGTSTASGTRDEFEQAGFPNLDQALLKEEAPPIAPTQEYLDGLSEEEKKQALDDHNAIEAAWASREEERKKKLEAHRKEGLGLDSPVLLALSSGGVMGMGKGSTHYDATMTDLGGQPGPEVLTGSYGVSSEDRGHNEVLSGNGTDQTESAGELAAGKKGNPVNPKSKGKSEPTSTNPIVGGNTMSLALADMDNDGDMDIIEANISHRSEFPTVESYRKRLERAGDTRTDEQWEEAWKKSSHDRRWADPSRLLLNQTDDAAREAEAEASQLEAEAVRLETLATSAEGEAREAEEAAEAATDTDEHANLLTRAQAARTDATTARTDAQAARTKATEARSRATEARKQIDGPEFADVSEDWGLPYAEGDIMANAADLDNDGRQDILMGQTSKYEHGEGGIQLYLQDEPGLLTQQTDEQSGLGSTTESGHVLLDLDNDGDLDLVSVGPDGGQVFNNEKGQDNNWIAIQVQGPFGGVSADAFGARVTLSVGDLKLTREVEGGGHDGQSDTRWLHFGLGKATTIDKVEIEILSGSSPKVEMPTSQLQIGKRNQISATGVKVL
ncbi:MAG: hypothetical protein ACI8RZ_005290 [Myxococcota bacterium]|jgi:hypothetical protein